MKVPTKNKLTMAILNLAMAASQRALTKSWQHEPTFGIMVDKDEWALKYQQFDQEISSILDTLTEARPRSKQSPSRLKPARG